MAAYDYASAARGGAPAPFNPLAAAAPDLAAKRAQSNINSQLYMANGARAPDLTVNVAPGGGIGFSPYQPPNRTAPAYAMPQAAPTVPQPVAPAPMPPQQVAPVPPALPPAPSDAEVRRQRALAHAQQVTQLRAAAPPPQAMDQYTTARNFYDQALRSGDRERAMRYQRHLTPLVQAMQMRRGM